jgi:hypothetical protein
LQLLNAQIGSEPDGPVISSLYLLRAVVGRTLSAPPADVLLDIGRASQLFGALGVGVLWQLKAEQLLRLDRFEEALEAADRALEMKETPADRSEVQKMRLIAVVGLRRWTEARALITELAQMNADDPTIKLMTVVVTQAGRGVEEVDQSLQTDLQGYPEKHPLRPGILILLTLTSALLDDEGRSLAYWRELSDQHLSPESARLFVDAIVALIQNGKTAVVKKLIAQSGDHRQLFPLRLAYQYLETRDRDLVEKLSPEVRGVVQEIAERLETTTAKSRLHQGGDGLQFVVHLKGV